MRKLLLIVGVLVLIAGTAFGQVYKFVDDGPFPARPDTFKYAINNGIAVDPAGNVWLQTYASNIDTLSFSPDTIVTGALFVYKPDGSQTAFSPVTILSGLDETGASVTDTLKASGYGMKTDWGTGNIVSIKPFSYVWTVDYTTGNGIRRTIAPVETGADSKALAGVGVDGLGEVFVCAVYPSHAGQILNPTDLTKGTLFADDIPGYGRDLAASADGNDVYVPRFSIFKTYVYHCDNGSLGPYAIADSFGIGASTECISVSPKNGYVWFDADSRSVRDSVNDYMWSGAFFYAYDPSTKAIVDSFQAWPTDPLYPRGIAFSPTGDTVYVAHFGAGVPYVERFVWTLVNGVAPVEDAVPNGYQLSQNYPNPFNPSTEIDISIAKAGFVSLKVYDMLGREVNTLLNQDMPAGVYKAKFDASGLSSGTYVYVLTAGDVHITKKMLLMK